MSCFSKTPGVASPLLNVALTKRNGMPMCGVPYHAAEGYLAKLIKAGKRVAIAEQTTEPQPGKIVEREIAQIISAGTIDDLNLLDSAKSNYPRCGLSAEREDRFCLHRAHHGRVSRDRIHRPGIVRRRADPTAAK